MSIGPPIGGRAVALDPGCGPLARFQFQFA
jgi:hypothetical protein